MSIIVRLNRLINEVRKPRNAYIVLVSAMGLGAFLAVNHFPVSSLSEWVFFYSLIGSILVLNHVNFQLPPEGNKLSMDSAIYLACVFIFGMDLALYVLLVSSIIYASYDRKTVLWKHIINFACYTLMIIGAHFTFIVTSGNIGPFNYLGIIPYLSTLAVYFSINVFIIGMFFLLSLRGTLFNVLKGILKETVTAYVSTLLFSLVLSILLTHHRFFGLVLFMVIAVLLSKSFDQLFRLYKEVSEKAIRDQRTGLYNHGYFEEVLERELRMTKENGQSLCLTILDIDNFKKYNDAYGHLKGDQLLEFFGTLLKKECSAEGVVVARYGGEEFSILMSNTTEREAFSFINNLRKKVNNTYFDGVEIFPHGCLSFSAGIVRYRKDIFDKNQMADQADQAMYYAKAQGKNIVHIYNDQSLLQKTIDIEQEVYEIEQQLKIFLSKDIYTFQHSKRVYRYAVEMCDKLSLSDHEKKTLILGALFHDIGKLEIPRDILNKKGKLNQDEWEIVKKHVLWGKEIVSTNEKFKDLIPLVELHHEKYDGTGYPYRLKAEEIPKLARILCIIDSFDAMTTERPYQKTKTFEEAIEELRAFTGRQFDPEFVEIFIELIEKENRSRFDLLMPNKDVG